MSDLRVNGSGDSTVSIRISESDVETLQEEGELSIKLVGSRNYSGTIEVVEDE